MVGLATVFGAGGGTSSYQEVETTDLIVMWGSNARNAHPIYFHHVLKGIHNGAKLYSVDPRRSETAQWADLWLGLNVGSDVALSNTIAREIIHAGLANKEFVEGSTTGFVEYANSVEEWTLERGSQVTGVPADAIDAVCGGGADAAVCISGAPPMRCEAAEGQSPHPHFGQTTATRRMLLLRSAPARERACNMVSVGF